MTKGSEERGVPTLDEPAGDPAGVRIVDETTSTNESSTNGSSLSATAASRKPTRTKSFGVGKRESHDSTEFYKRFTPPIVSSADDVATVPDLDDSCILGDARDMSIVPDNSVALVVTSPPYFVGKDYELDLGGKDAPVVPASYIEYLELLRDVFAECVRVLEPGGRIAVNVANLGRKPYRSLSSDVIRILQDDLHLLLRGEVIWQKGEGATGSVAWGSFRRAANPVLRDVTERVIIASKGRFDRARPTKQRVKDGLPHENTVTTDEFMEATLDLWRIDPERATRVNHPAPFPVELPRRLIDLYTYQDDVVLDPFVGSGTTLVAALRAGRRGIGFDLDDNYLAIARERLRTEAERQHSNTASPEVGSDTVRLENQAETIESAPPSRLFDGFEAVTTAEDFQRRASKEGKKAQDIAKLRLEEAGFEIGRSPAKLRGLGVQFNFEVISQVDGQKWFVDVSGAFTTARPGLRRTDTLWKTLGRAYVLSTQPDHRLLILTSHLPRPGSEGDKALRAVAGKGVFDALEMFDSDDQVRLTTYATEVVDRPQVGFWSPKEIDKFFD